MKIGGLQKTSLIDFPGRVAAVVFTQGCAWRCAFCHNPSLVKPDCFQPAIPEEEVFTFLDKRRGQLDGVVISGGEPTIHPDLPGFIARIKDLGFAVKLDTNGDNPEAVRHLIGEDLLDYIAMDIKAPLNNYSQICGRRVEVEALRNCIWLIKQSGVDHEFRTTVVPGLHTIRELKAIGELVRGAQRYVVQDFVGGQCLRRDLQGRPAFPIKPLRDLKAFMQRRVQHYEIRSAEEAIPMPTGRGKPLAELLSE